MALVLDHHPHGFALHFLCLMDFMGKVGKSVCGGRIVELAADDASAKVAHSFDLYAIAAHRLDDPINQQKRAISFLLGNAVADFLEHFFVGIHSVRSLVGFVRILCNSIQSYPAKERPAVVLLADTKKRR